MKDEETVLEDQDILDILNDLHDTSDSQLQTSVLDSEQLNESGHNDPLMGDDDDLTQILHNTELEK